MSDEFSASVFCFTPLRVPANEVGQHTAPPLPNASPDSTLAPPDPDPSSLSERCPICLRATPNFEAFRQAAYWKAMHQRACQREDKLHQRIAELEASLRLREQQLFGRKTETSKATAPNPTTTPPADQLQLKKNVVGKRANRGTHAVITPICPVFPKSSTCPRISVVARIVTGLLFPLEAVKIPLF